MKMPELLPCPFCGGEAERLKWDNGFAVGPKISCRENGCVSFSGNARESYNRIEQRWNQRADLMDRQQLVKAIKILDTAVYDFQRNQVRDILIGLLAGNTMIGDKP